jgi:hypothetical protein
LFNTSVCTQDSNGIFTCPDQTVGTQTFSYDSYKDCVCNGNGVCNATNQTQCICNKGYTGIGCKTAPTPPTPPPFTNRCSNIDVDSFGSPYCSKCYDGFELTGDKYTKQACQITKNPFYWSNILGTGCYCKSDCNSLRECNNCRNNSKPSTTTVAGISTDGTGCGSGCSLSGSNATFLNIIPNPNKVSWSTDALEQNTFRAGLHGWTTRGVNAYSAWDNTYNTPENISSSGGETIRLQCRGDNLGRVGTFSVGGSSFDVTASRDYSDATKFAVGGHCSSKPASGCCASPNPPECCKSNSC